RPADQIRAGRPRRIFRAPRACRPPRARRNLVVARASCPCVSRLTGGTPVPLQPPQRLWPRLRSKSRARRNVRRGWRKTGRRPVPAANRCRHFSPKFSPTRGEHRRRRLRQQISKNVVPRQNHLSKNVAVTTAVMVLSRELVSFSPSPLMSVLCSGVI